MEKNLKPESTNAVHYNKVNIISNKKKLIKQLAIINNGLETGVGHICACVCGQTIDDKLHDGKTNREHR